MIIIQVTQECIDKAIADNKAFIEGKTPRLEGDNAYSLARCCPIAHALNEQHGKNWRVNHFSFYQKRSDCYPAKKGMCTDEMKAYIEHWDLHRNAVPIVFEAELMESNVL